MEIHFPVALHPGQSFKHRGVTYQLATNGVGHFAVTEIKRALLAARTQDQRTGFAALLERLHPVNHADFGKFSLDARSATLLFHALLEQSRGDAARLLQEVTE